MNSTLPYPYQNHLQSSDDLVTTYAAKPIGTFKPKDHYLDWVVKGLKQWKFPEDVIQQWESYRPR